MGYTDYIDRTGAAALIPEEAVREILKSISEGSVIMKLGRRLPNMARGQTRLPVLSALPEAYFVTERSGTTPGGTSMKQTSEAAWANKYLDAEEIACIVPIPQSVLDDADYDIWSEIKPAIVEAIGKTLDAAVLFGTNAPAAWPDDILTAATAAGNTVALGTGADLYDDLLGENGVIAAVEADGFMCSGHIGAIALRGKLRGLRDDYGQPIFKPTMQGSSQYELDGAPIEFPRNGAMDATQALLISGAFDQLVYAIRSDVTYKLITEGVITTNANPPVIQYNLAQEDMVALRVTFRAAWQVPNPENRVQPTDGSRYPFGVLTPASSGS